MFVSKKKFEYTTDYLMEFAEKIEKDVNLLKMKACKRHLWRNGFCIHCNRDGIYHGFEEDKEKREWKAALKEARCDACKKHVWVSSASKRECALCGCIEYASINYSFKER